MTRPRLTADEVADMAEAVTQGRLVDYVEQLISDYVEAALIEESVQAVPTGRHGAS